MLRRLIYSSCNTNKLACTMRNSCTLISTTLATMLELPCSSYVGVKTIVVAQRKENPVFLATSDLAKCSAYFLDKVQIVCEDNIKCRDREGEDFLLNHNFAFLPNLGETSLHVWRSNHPFVLSLTRALPSRRCRHVATIQDETLTPTLNQSSTIKE